MPENVLAKAWTPDELAKIGKEKHLTTQFMNQLNFDKATIKYYPYGQRKFFVGTHAGQEQRFYATDEQSAAWWYEQRYGVKPGSITEISEGGFTSPTVTTTVATVAIGKGIAIPKVKLPKPPVEFNGDCFDRGSLDIILKGVDGVISSASRTLSLEQQRLEFLGRGLTPQSPGVKELGLLKATRDFLAEAPICAEMAKPGKPAEKLEKRPAKALMKPAPKAKAPLSEEEQIPEKLPEPEFRKPYVRVMDVNRQLKYYSDARGKQLPRELWPSQK